MDEIDQRGYVPVYQQLASILRQQIESGELRAREPIPAKRYLKERYGVAGNTVDRAVAVLRAEGLVVTVIGRGIYVRPPEERPAPQK